MFNFFSQIIFIYIIKYRNSDKTTFLVKNIRAITCFEFKKLYTIRTEKKSLKSKFRKRGVLNVNFQCRFLKRLSQLEIIKRWNELVARESGRKLCPCSSLSHNNLFNVGHARWLSVPLIRLCILDETKRRHTHRLSSWPSLGRENS